MIEFIKHLTGLCGESHLNIIPVILIVMLLGVTFKLKKI